MQPATGGSSGTSPWKRYLPIAAVGLVIAVAVGVFAVIGGDDDDDDGSSTTPGGGDDIELPITYAQAEEAGTVDDHDWGNDCDPDRGTVALPLTNPAPCVPVWDGDDNGGATHRGITADTIRIGFYRPPPDPAGEALLRASGAYDEPETAEATLEAYKEVFQATYETYGRDIELVLLDGTGAAEDEQAARADAIRAAEELDLFAVINGPTQAVSFSQTLADREVLCIGTCLLAQPRQFFEDNFPYVWVYSSSPNQAGDHTLEFIQKQLAGRPAEFAGDEAFHDQERTFALLTYDTPDGNFTPVWDEFADKMEDAGTPLEGRVTYFLDLASAQEDARTLVTRLKEIGATSVIFSGDPLMPRYFTTEATNQGYFPEWILSGTVLADTNVLARAFDPEQWAHAFGYSAVAVSSPKEQSVAYGLHEWWYGTEPEQENGFAITLANMQLAMLGIHLAGPDLTPESFGAAVHSNPPIEQGPLGLRTITSYGDHGLWPYTDFNGNDNATLIWWDPEAEGEDETGALGQGMYRYVDGGRRYVPGEWPTEPMGLFEDGITTYDQLPDELGAPEEYPPNPESAVAGSG